MRRIVSRGLRQRGLSSLCILGGYCLGGLIACEAEPAPSEGKQEQALRSARHERGKRLFEQPFPESNGRACATCHVGREDFTLKPDSVAARLRDHPEDPLFNRLDADDPDAQPLTFEALKKGLVRVTLKLPDNMDVIDSEGTVITAPDRTIFVWRGVPSVADTALSAPYQLDGREPTLQVQAQNAILSHSQGRKVASYELDLIAQFQRSTFSSPRARAVSALLDFGFDPDRIPVPEDHMKLNAQEQRGREVYEAGCVPCHGGPTTDRIQDRALHTFFSPAFTPEGNVRFTSEPGTEPQPVRVERPGTNFMNVGFGAATYAGQIGIAPSFNGNIKLPRYRFRFYTDAARSSAVVDLPPKPQTVSGSPFDLRPLRDQNGAPIVGPNLIPQAFTTDPGRAVITGDPADFEAFDMPQLRGIARTAPYFHDNSRATLRDVVDEYSRFVLPFATPMGFPKLPPEQPGGRPEALTPEQKLDLIAFLERL